MSGQDRPDGRSSPRHSDIDEVAEVVRESFWTLHEQTAEKASELMQALRERGQTVLKEQKTRAAVEIQHLGAAVRRAAFGSAT